MNFKHYINGVEVEEPEGFLEYPQEIIRDDKERVIRYNFPLNLTFVANGYEIIEAQYQLSFNSELEYRVYRIEEYTETLEAIGIIKMSNCEWNLTAKPKPSVNVEIDDNVYQSAIFGNKSRPLNVASKLSLNGVEIGEVVPVEVTMFDSETGNNIVTARKLYDAFDVLKHAIYFISDGRVELISDWYSNLPSDQKTGINTGANLRLPASTKYIAPTVNFADHFAELWKKYNLYLIVEDILTDNPKIRLEPESYLYSDSTGIFLTENDTITRTIDYDKLFNRLVIGSETFIQDLGNVEPMYYTPFLSFVKETYNIDGVIGVDNELNLVSKYVIDSNEISDFIQGSNTNHDDKIFMVQYDAVNLTATKGEYFPGDNPNSKYYNEQLLNSNVAQRFDYLGTVALGLGNLDALFRAGQELPVIQNGLHIDDIDDVIWTVPPDTLTVYGRYRFDNDSTPPNFDTDNNFDLPLNQFVAPISGTYRFEFSFIFKVRQVLPNPSYDMGAFIGFRIDGSQLSYPETISAYRTNNNGTEPYSGYTLNNNFQMVEGLSSTDQMRYTAGHTMTLEAGQNVSVWAQVKASNYEEEEHVFSIETSGAYFRNIASPLGGGVYVENDPNDYYIGVYNIEKEGITLAEWDMTQQNPTWRIIMDTGQNDPRITYLKKISRNIVSGESTIELIFNRNQTFK